jgi:large repetitive protein
MSFTRNGSLRRLSIAAALVLLGTGSWILLRPASAQPALTLQSIAIDAAFGDWDPVLANAGQTTRDGDGSSNYLTSANCGQFSTDRDCPQGHGAGNDLLTFAWTYDASYVYLYMERYGSANNGVDFFFVADVDRDRLLTAADKVIWARWFGTTGRVDIETGSYAPASPAGVPIACTPAAPATTCGRAPPGYVDGYSLAGGATTAACTNPSLCSGMGDTTARAGEQMELRIAWSQLGFPAPQPFFWHVSSSNNGSLASTVDNIGAPDGRLGSFFYRAVTLSPDHQGAVASPGTVSYDHVLANGGNGEDLFDLVATSAAAARLELVVDGAVIAVDTTGDGTWETISAGHDANTDGRPDLALPFEGTKDLQVRVVMPEGRTGEDVTRLTAISTGDRTVSAIATDTSKVGSPAIIPGAQSKATVPGQAVPFAMTVINTESFPDTFALSTGGGCAGYDVRLLGDAAGSPGAELARDADGDGTWDTVATDTDGDLLPDRGVQAANGGSAPIWLEVTPPAGQALGSVCTVNVMARSAATSASDTAANTVTVGPEVSFEPSYTFAAGTNKSVGPGEAVLFPGVIQNNEDEARSYTVTAPTVAPSDLAGPRVWTDPDGDGNPSDGVVLSGPTEPVSAYGGRTHLVIEVRAATAAGASLAIDTQISVTARAVATTGGAATADQLDQARVGHLGTFSDPLLVSNASAFAPCDVVFAQAQALRPSDNVSYHLEWRDPLGTVVQSVFPWATTSRATAEDELHLPASAPAGIWTLVIHDGATTLDTLAFRVERTGAFTSLATDRTRYASGDALAVTAAVASGQSAAPFTATTLHYVLEDLAGTRYADLTGAFHDAPGTTRLRSGLTVQPGAAVADGFAIGALAYPAPGRYQVRAEWRLACGASPVIASAVSGFDVAPTPPAITSPSAGALLATRRPTLAGLGRPGAAVTVRSGAVIYGPVTVDAGGGWSYALAQGEALADGVYTLVAEQAVEGVVSGPSPAVGFAVDATAPAAPTLAAIATPTRTEPIPVSGTAEADGVVTLLLDGAPVASFLATAGGTFSTTLAGVVELPAHHVLTATVRDGAGNTSPPSDAVSFTVDRTPPAAPVLAPLATTAADPVIVAGTAEPLAAIRGLVDGGAPQTTTAGADGAFTLAFLGLPELSAPHDLSVIATDPAGNASDPATLAFTVDRTPPAPPVLAPIDTPTRIEPIVASGTAEPGATVRILLDGAPFASGAAGPDGAYAVPLAGVADGTHAAAAEAVDAAGNVGVASAPAVFTVDRTPPAAPILAPLASPTHADPVVFAGTAEAGAAVAVLVDGVAAGGATADASGAFSVGLGVVEGSHQVTARATDAVGNVGAESVAVALVVDRSAPALPAIEAPAEGALVGAPAAPGGLVTFSGTAEALALVRIVIDGAIAREAPADGAGAWSIAVPLLEGPHDLRARAEDAAGNQSAFGVLRSFGLDTVAPPAPLLAPVGSHTRADPVIVMGSAEPGATVTVRVDGAPVATAVADGTGAFSAAVLDLAEGGRIISAVASDAAGNASDASDALSVTVDRTAPAAPAVAHPANGAALAAGDVEVAGTAEAGATVAVSANGGAPVTVIADPGGAWTVVLALPDGAHALAVTAADAAGNLSPASARAITVDTEAPLAPVLAGTAGPTAAAPVPVAGTAEPGVSVEILDGVAAVGAATAGPDGAFATALALDEGTHALTARARDEAGNVSLASPAVTLVVDRTAPTAPVLDPLAPSAAMAVTLGGSAEAQAVVELTAGAAPLATVTASLDGAFAAPVSLEEGTHVIEARARDAAGNLSPVSEAVAVVVDLTAPVAPVLTAPAPGAFLASGTVTISGTGEAGARASIAVDGGEPTLVEVLGDGTFSVPAPLADGGHTIALRIVDGAGNVSPVLERTFTVDTVGPAAPIVSTPAGGARLASAAVLVTGTGEPGATVAVVLDGGSPATVVVAGDASFAVPLSAVEGEHAIAVTVSDPAGNVSAAVSRAFSVDTLAPAAPGLTAPAAGALLATRAVAVTGSGEPGALVSISLDGGAPVAAVIGPDGAFAAVAEVPSDGDHTVSIRVADATGNVSPAVDRSFTVDTVAPAVPALATPAAGALLASSAVIVTGTAEPGATVAVRLDAGAPALTVADGAGLFALSFAPSDGPHTISVTASDAAGNASGPCERAFALDTLAPAAPAVATPAAGAALASGALIVAGIAEPGATISVQLDAEPAVAGAVGVDGAYSVALSAADGQHSVVVVAADPAGNVSSPASRAFSVDTVAPAAPVVAAPAPFAAVATATVIVSGLAEDGATVAVSLDGGAAVSTTATGGIYEVPLPVADGEHAVTVTAADLAGNVSPSAERSFSVDTVAPAAPTLEAPDATVSPGAIEIGGHAEAGARVEIALDGGTPTTVTAGADGAFTLAATVGEGSHAVQAIALDAAGNASPAVDLSFTAAGGREGSGGCGCGSGSAPAPAAAALLALLAFVPRRRRRG